MTVERNAPKLQDDWIPVETESSVLWEVPPQPVEDNDEPEAPVPKPSSNKAATTQERVPTPKLLNDDYINFPTDPNMARYRDHVASSPNPSLRMTLSTSVPFPTTISRSGFATTEPDGLTPVYMGSALDFKGGVHPCKIVPHLYPAMVHVSYGGEEVEHFGQYDLLPYDPELMEWVWSQDGRVSEGKLGVVGGIEDGKVLYHAIAKVPTFWPWDESVWVPGKAAEYLNGANIAFGGKEHWTADCKILCWK